MAANIICGLVGFLVLWLSPFLTHTGGEKSKRRFQVVLNLLGGLCLMAAGVPA